MIFFGYILLSVMFLQQSSNGCKVISESISLSYEGECRRGFAHGFGIAEGSDRYEGDFKRGLPHGTGTYTWENGDIYKGEWCKGERHGRGVLINADKDTLARGIWKKDQFIRETSLSSSKPAYLVRYQKNITRLRFVRVSDGNRVLIKLDEGSGARQISHLSVFGTSGQYISYPNMFGYEEVTFPFEGRIVFYGPSKTGYTTYLIELTFEINNPGNWEVHIIY